jgi:dTDP-4-amino-4,6-dideoxygalactose transaminase
MTQLANCKNIKLPTKREGSNHVFHQFTLIIGNNKRDSLREVLKERGISTMVYYPIPLNQQPAYKHFAARVDLQQSESLSGQVLSIPIHDALSQEEVKLVAKSINEYFEI